MPEHEKPLGHDLQVQLLCTRGLQHGISAWGKLDGYRFDAFMMRESCNPPGWCLRGTEILSLEVRRWTDDTVVFRWNRGLEVDAKNARTQSIVDFLSRGLQRHVTKIEDALREAYLSRKENGSAPRGKILNLQEPENAGNRADDQHWDRAVKDWVAQMKERETMMANRKQRPGQAPRL